jgi:two-component system cell cycle sensor histidine kinase/response regulator CckA
MPDPLPTRRPADEALRESEARFRTLFENCPIGLGMADERGNLIAYNDAMLRPGGYTREDIQRIGNVAALYASAEDREAALALARRQGFLDRHEVRFKRKDGSHYLARLSLRPIGVHGERGWQAMVEDVTELKRLEAQAVQTGKMESVARLAGGIAHDFNNILTAILGYSDQLARRLAGGGGEELAGIRDMSLRAAALVRQLLGFARQQKVEPRVLDPAAALAGMRDGLERLAGPTVRVEFDPAPATARVLVDPDQLGQVLTELVRNAREAMPDGGSVRIRVETASCDGAAPRLPALPAGDFVLISVADTGPGIPADTQPRLFEPFFTTKPQGEGPGLGLATCYGILKQNGGHIWADSPAGRGSTFFVALPAASAGPAPAAPSPEHADRGKPGPGLILLAEDEPSVRRVAAAALRGAAYAIIEAPDGASALHRLEEAGAAPQALITDVVMPGMGGRDLADHLWRRHPDLPVLFISGYPRDSLDSATLQRPHVRFLQKPFLPADLVVALEGLLAQRRE